MSVLIRGMEMPTSCWKCRFDVRGYCVASDREDNRTRFVDDAPKKAWCPLIPVPPHGELCDKDALVKKIGEHIDSAKERSHDWWYACTVAYDFALAAPTIIPADHIGDVNEMVTDKEGEG